jgi:hypothetical protein
MDDRPFLFGIVTAFRSRSLARNWDHHVWMLQRTLSSMLAQTNDAFVIFLVGHEIPDILQIKHPKVRCLSVDFPPPQRNNDDMCVDKVLKLSIGMERAIGEGCTHIMISDADDLVSRRLCDLAARNRNTNGWYSPSTFFHAYGSRWVRKSFCARSVSMPCAIVKADLLRFANPPFSGAWAKMTIKGGERAYLELLASRNRKVNTFAAAGHAYFQRLMMVEGDPLIPLPFVGTIMINHFDSTSYVTGGLGTIVPERPALRATLRRRLVRYRRLVSTLPFIRPVTWALREEFTIPALRDIPAAPRQKGSMFSRDIDVESWLGKS